jgi:hypothetical protein
MRLRAFGKQRSELLILKRKNSLVVSDGHSTRSSVGEVFSIFDAINQEDVRLASCKKESA